MLEIFFVVLSFSIGRWMGIIQSSNKDITKQTLYMQNLIDEAYKKRDAMKASLVEAEERAESWQRRYWNIVEEGEDL